MKRVYWLLFSECAKVGCCIELETPQSIKDTQDMDVFEIISEGSAYQEKIVKAMWAMYRNRGIGDTDIETWLTALQDMYDSLYEGYSQRFAVYEAYLQTDYTDLSDGSSEVVYEHEDTPSTAVITTKYLATRDTTKVKSFSGLPATTLKDNLDAVQDPYRSFAYEFKNLFYARVVY